MISCRCLVYLSIASSCAFVLRSEIHAAAGVADVAPGRERLSINDGWRFHRGDPEGVAAGLSYDVRPEVTIVNDQVVADAKPTEAAATAAAGEEVLKPWILPTGNAFLKDPSRHYRRPAGEPKVTPSFVRADFDDTSWRLLNLPHDWAIEGPFIPTGPGGGMGRLPNEGIGLYRRQLDIPARDAGRRIFLDVDGAMSYAAVWINGKLAGGWPFGYASWRVDLTPYVRFGGVNQLAIRLDNPGHSSRWYPGGGIYRNVWLTKTHPVHVDQWGTFISSRDVSEVSATVDVEVVVVNADEREVRARVDTLIHEAGADGRAAGQPIGGVAQGQVVLAPKSRALSRGSLVVNQPRLWGPPQTQVPHRYVAVTRVLIDGATVDTYETPFGIRALRFDPGRGLYVNGEHIRIQGVNQHHDLGALGAAFNVRAARRQLEMLQEMGCNAIRMAHNPPAPELLHLADEMGLLVMDEAFDVWERKKTPLDFHLIFPDWHEQDLRAMVRRDRNHPSVVIWSVGNEVGEQYTDAAGAALARSLCDIVHEEDPTRPATASMNYAKPDMPFPAALDLISLNYQGEGIRFTPEFVGTDRIRTPPQYPAFRERFPDKVILSSETASAFSSRGVYLFPVTGKNSDIVRDGRGGDSSIRHVSAYELHAVDFGASADKVFAALDGHPFVAGEFVWTGWDHLGEPTPYYDSRSSYAGIIDLAGFKKDRFYLYQARWRPDLAMAHILPHWSWPERVGQVTPVHVFTSGDEAELFLNGRSLGRKSKGEFEYRLRWDDVVYEPGELKVVAYRNGAAWAEDVVRTAGKPARLQITVDRPEIRADGRDLAFFTVRVTDDSGNTAPRADNAIRFAVDSPGEIVATDNGDPTSFEPFQASERKAFSGLCLVVVRGHPGKAGRIQIVGSSDGLREATAIVTTRR